jgi:hypothetical protein
MASQAKSVRSAMKRAGFMFGYGSKTWVIQIRHSEHTIEIERKWRHTKLITLRVDGEILAEGTPEDIDCHRGMWQCTFRFIGERVIVFDMFETSAEGTPLNTKVKEEQRHNITHACVVSVTNFNDMSLSTLTVNGVDYRQLPQQMATPPSEHNLSTALMVLEAQYDITVPVKVNRNVGANGQLLSRAISHHSNASSFFGHGFDQLMGTNTPTNSGFPSIPSHHSNMQGMNGMSSYDQYGNPIRNDSITSPPGYMQSLPTGYASGYKTGAGYQYYHQGSATLFERVVMCMCSPAPNDEDHTGEFPPLLSWDSSLMAEHSRLGVPNDQYGGDWQYDGVGASGLSGMAEATGRAGKRGESGVVRQPNNKDPASWESEGSSRPGSPSRTGKQTGKQGQGIADVQLSAADLRAMGLSEAEIRQQLNSLSALDASSGSPKKTGQQGNTTGSTEFSAADLRAMGLSEEEIRMQLGSAHGQTSNNAASKLTPAELRAMGLTEAQAQALPAQNLAEMRAQILGGTGGTGPTGQNKLGGQQGQLGGQQGQPGQLGGQQGQLGGQQGQAQKGKGKGKKGGQQGQPGALTNNMLDNLNAVGNDLLPAPGQSSRAPTGSSTGPAGSMGTSLSPPTGTMPRDTSRGTSGSNPTSPYNSSMNRLDGDFSQANR